MRGPGSNRQRARCRTGLLIGLFVLLGACSEVPVDVTPTTEGTTAATPERPAARAAGEPTDDQARAVVEPSSLPEPAVVHLLGSIGHLDPATTPSPPEILQSDLASIATLACAPDTNECPADTAERLGEQAIDIANVAIGPLGAIDPDSLDATATQLETAGIDVLGWGEDIEAAVQPVRIEHPDQPLAVFAVSLADDGLDRTAHATETEPGIAGPDAFVALLAAMGSSAETGDRVVVLVDWGDVDRRAPDEDAVELAAALIRAGAEAVVGTGSEFLNRLEVIEGAPVVFDLGRAATDTEDPLRRDTAVLRLRFDDTGTDFCLLPAAATPTGIALDENGDGDDGEDDCPRP